MKIIRVRPWSSIISVFIRRDIRVLPFCFCKVTQDFREKVAICNPREEVAPLPKPAEALVLDF